MTFWCHNVQKSALSYTALLSEWADEGPDVVLIQEPPWIQVGTQRSLEDPEGSKNFGTPTLRGFHTFYPNAATWSTSSLTQRPRSILLVHKRWTSLSIQYCQALSPTKDICTVKLDVTWSDGLPCPLYISSCYNGAPDENPTLDTVLGDLAVPPDAHWILGGDFNRHHSDWSARMAPSASPGQAAALRSFIGQRGLSILNDPEVATRRSPEGGADTVMDLTLCSPTLSDLGMEASLDVSFNTASYSDHALLTWTLPLSAVQTDTFTSNRLPRTALMRWQRCVAPLLPRVFALQQDTPQDLDVKVQTLHEACISAMSQAINLCPKRKGVPKAPWWNKDCADHVDLLRTLRGPEKKATQRLTRRVFRQAKRDFYNGICEDATPDTIWGMAKWGSGNRTTPIIRKKILH